LRIMEKKIVNYNLSWSCFYISYDYIYDFSSFN
jgi:hypothetical protein